MQTTNDTGPNSTYMSAFGQQLYYDYATNKRSTVPGSLTGYVPGHAALSAVQTSSGTIDGMTAGQVAGGATRRSFGPHWVGVSPITLRLMISPGWRRPHCLCSDGVVRPSARCLCGHLSTR